MKNCSIEDIENRCEGLKILPFADGYKDYYKKADLKYSVKGYVFLLNDEYVGAAGIELRPDSFYVFSEMKEDVKINKQTIWRCTKLIMDIIERMNKMTVAVSEKDNKSAHAFCKKLGFKQYADDESHVYFYREASK